MRIVSREVMSLFAAAAFISGLAGCSSNDNANLISQIQQATVQACSFLPTVETVANILTANATLVPMTVAKAICAAVTIPGSSRFGERPEVPAGAYVMIGKEKVFVKGEFVK